MPAKPIIQDVAVTDTLTALADASTICPRLTIGCPGTNADDVTFSAAGEAEATRPPGWSGEFHGCDLADIRVKGTSGDVIELDAVAGGV